ncbi:MAG: hypothetical protein M9924_08135 [Rhizobiaceae bacterium]|nr:hypothetical protein [Rhizobiaceae bacterium]
MMHASGLLRGLRRPTLRIPAIAGELLIAVAGGIAVGIAAAIALDEVEHREPPATPMQTEAVRASPAELARPMQFSPLGNGVLQAIGSIEPGTASRLAHELEARSPDIRTVSLNSPGGSLDEAMAMGKLLRESGLATEVPDGAVCASACPLLFAGGVARSAGQRAAIGVHQFYARPVAGLRGSLDAMSDAQLTTARISRHLTDMGVDPTAWLHALDTPPSSLYYYSSWELADYRLTTTGAPAPVAHFLGELARFLGKG